MESKKLAALVGAISLTVGALGGAVAFPVDKEVIVEKNVTIEKPVEVIKVVNTVETVEVPVEVVVEKLVDNGNLSVVEQFIFDNNGDLEFITNDLDDNEVDQIASRIIFANEVKQMALDAVEKDLFDELDNEVFNGTTFDEGDMERLRLDDDADEIVITDYDFKDGDAKVKVTGSFEQDDVKFEFNATVKIVDGEYDELVNVNVFQ